MSTYYSGGDQVISSPSSPLKQLNLLLIVLPWGWEMPQKSVDTSESLI